MISYIRHNSVFDLGTRSGESSCKGLYAELDDLYSKYINPQVRVWYVTEDSTTDCLCNMAGKQKLSDGTHSFIFQNGIITVTVAEDDTVTVAEVSSGDDGGSSGGEGGDGGLTILNWTDINSYSDTIGGRSFNSETDSLWIGDGLREPYTYGFVDSLDAPFALVTAFPPQQGETQTIKVTDLYTFFETTENYQAAETASAFYLARADKIIKVKESSSQTEITFILIVGNFEISFGIS